MAGTNGRRPGRSVTSKVLALLDAFTPAAPEMSLNELSRRTGLPLSTTYRLAGELVEWVGLERGENGGYRIGLRLWEVGSLAPRGTSVREIALPFMQDLYEATHENVQLNVLAGHEALTVEMITGHRAVNLISRRGGRLPLHATAGGKALLAYAPDALVEEVVAAGLDRYTPHTIVAPGQLRRTLAAARRAGVAFAREEMQVGTVSVAAPMFDRKGVAVAALSIVLRSTEANLRQLAPAVRTAALCASRQIRTQAPDPAARPEPQHHPMPR